MGFATFPALPSTLAPPRHRVCTLARMPSPCASSSRLQSPRCCHRHARSVRRCCCPRPLRVRRAGCGRSRRRAQGPSHCLPRDAPPFGAFPSPAAAPRHRGPCLLAVLPIFARLRSALPPCRCRAPTFADLEALLHRRVRCDDPRCRVTPPDAPMGLRRSQGSTRLSRLRPEGREAPRCRGNDRLLSGMPASRQRASSVGSVRSCPASRGRRSALERLSTPAVPSGAGSPRHSAVANLSSPKCREVRFPRPHRTVSEVDTEMPTDSKSAAVRGEERGRGVSPPGRVPLPKERHSEVWGEGVPKCCPHPAPRPTRSRAAEGERPTGAAIP
jgi:hypothetical protein